MSRRAPKPWGDQLWDRVERLLERLDAEDEFTLVDFQEGVVVQEVMIEIHEIRKAMTAENARRAAQRPSVAGWSGGGDE